MAIVPGKSNRLLSPALPSFFDLKKKETKKLINKQYTCEMSSDGVSRSDTNQMRNYMVLDGLLTFLCYTMPLIVSTYFDRRQYTLNCTSSAKVFLLCLES